MKRALLILGITGMFGIASAADTNWPQWRGPAGNGVAESLNLPTHWSDTENVIWKIDLPSYSSSTPAIWGDKLFLIGPEAGEATPEGVLYAGGVTFRTDPRGAPERVGKNPGGPGLYLMCLDKNTGVESWRQKLGDGNIQVRKGNMANTSPVVDGERVYAMTGTGILTAFDFAGKEIWKRDVQGDTGKFSQTYAYGSSPLLYKDRIVVAVMHHTTGAPVSSYLMALNSATGEPIWKTVRPTDAIQESPDAYTTPQLLDRNGSVEVVINGGDVVTGHDIMTGAEVWRIGGLNPRNNPLNRIVPSVTIAPNGIVIVPAKEQPMLALDANDRDAQGAPKVLWKSTWGPDVSSPVTDGKYVWMYSKDSLGIIVCQDARTGAPVYERQRLEAGGYHTSSLLMANGKIYALNENAETTVIEAGAEFKVVSRNTLDASYTMASIAVSGDRLYIRTGEHLYCIGNK